VDLALGFAMAVYLGRRWRALADARCWAGLGALASASRAGGLVPGAAAPPPAAAADAVPQSPCQQAVAALHQEVASYGRELGDADDRLRQFAAAPDISGIEACLSRLDAVSREYVDHRDAAQRRLTDLMQDAQMAEEIRRDLQVASQLQDVEIKRTRQDIVHFDHDGDPGRSCLKMVEQTQRLISAGDHLRDTLDHTLAETVRQEGRAGASEAALAIDPLTGCITRPGIEAKLAALAEQAPAGRRLCAAMLDLDRFTQVNERLGYSAGNGILAAIGRLLRAECTGPTDVARYAGQRFLLVFSDLGLHEATGVVERIRQIIEKVRFETRNADVRTTVSCAVTEALVAEPAPSLLGRVEAALAESKRYGRNRTFAYEGRFPTPVVPPELEIDERRMPL
jgi:diguanylate cyclase (GGDEF)-like protein